MSNFQDETDRFQRIAAVLHRKPNGAPRIIDVNKVAADLGIKKLKAVEARRVMQLVEAMRAQLVDKLTDELGKGQDTEPKASVIADALTSAGCRSNRQLVAEVQKSLRQRYGAHWETSPETILRSIVSYSDKEYYETLQKVYGVNGRVLMRMLIRTFALGIATNRIDPVDLPSMALSLRDEDVRRFAKALNFKVKLKSTRLF